MPLILLICKHPIVIKFIGINKKIIKLKINLGLLKINEKNIKIKITRAKKFFNCSIQSKDKILNTSQSNSIFGKNFFKALLILLHLLASFVSFSFSFGSLFNSIFLIFLLS